MTRTVLTVEGMSCPSCTEHVRHALARDGVANVEVQLDAGAVVVDHAREVDVAQLIAALGEAGYVARDGRAAVPATACPCCA